MRLIVIGIQDRFRSTVFSDLSYFITRWIVRMRGRLENTEKRNTDLRAIAYLATTSMPG